MDAVVMRRNDEGVFVYLTWPNSYHEPRKIDIG